MALNLPLLGAYFPSSLHQYFAKPKSGVTAWGTLDDFEAAASLGCSDAIYFFSGSLSFIRNYVPRQCDPASTCICLETVFRECDRHRWHRLARRDLAFVSDIGFVPLSVKHSRYGGATSAAHVMGFSPSLVPAGTDLSKSPMDVPRSIAHFMSDAANISRVELEDLVDPPDSSYAEPLSRIAGYQGAKNLLDRNGLFPVMTPTMKIACPSVFIPRHTKSWCRRQLTVAEARDIYSIPTCYAKVGVWPTHIGRPLPFENAVSPDILTTLFRQMWGVELGGEEVGDKPSSSYVSDLTVEESASSCGIEDSDANLSVMDAEAPTSCETTGLEAVDAREEGVFDVGDRVLTKQHGVLMRGQIHALTDQGYLVELDLQSGALEVVHGPNELILVPRGGDLIHHRPSDTPESDPPSPYPLLIPSFPAPQSSLDKASEDLKFSKAVKSDDAAVPEHLWNDRIFTKDVVDDGPTMLFCFPSVTRQDGSLVGLPVTEEVRIGAANVLRRWGLCIYRRNLLGDCLKRLRQKFDKKVKLKGEDGKVVKKKGKAVRKTVPWWNTTVNPREVNGKVTKLAVEIYAMSNILWHAAEATWFEYPCGSHINYFRFPVIYQQIARDGVRVYFQDKGPTSMEKQRDLADDEVRAKVKKKLEKVVNRRYIIEAGVTLKSLIKYFAVPKGDDDIRMVYDATANDLNAAVWVPSFWLPTIDSITRALDSNSFMMDCDVGEQFLNFPLHRDVWPYTGLDLGPIRSEKDSEEGEEKARWFHWVRMLMGFKPSPYISVKMTLIAEEIVRGDRHDVDNPFHWSTTRLNLPGSKDYDPRKSWIAKIREDGRVAADLFTFVDDERVTAPDEEIAWKAAHQLGSIQAYLGIQNATRKLRDSSQTPGAWAGSVVHVIPEHGVCVLTSPEKWNKLKGILKKWLDRITDGDEKLDHKELLSDRGFLVYVTRTYPAMVPYLKGFHLTIENWRGSRDSEGWKFDPAHISEEQEDQVEEEGEKAAVAHKIVEDLDDVVYHRAPEDGYTTAVPRFIEDLQALSRLSNFELPPLRIIRGKVVFSAVYGFVDASGKGFGGTMGDGEQDVTYRMGIWGRDAEDKSSNYRELRNLVEHVESEATKGNLSNTELFIFTDNSTAEGAFYRNNSSSKLLHELVVRLRLVEIEHSVIIHVIHVSGDRMKDQGTDAVSRGSRNEGVMAGHEMLNFVPLGKTAVERHPPLLEWIQDWTSRPDLEPLTTDEWFERAHGIIGGQKDAHGVWIPTHEKAGGLHLWTPPPAIADVALEELLKARHKRTDTCHVIVVPRVMTPRWRRLFNKACDVSFTVPANSSIWPNSMYEPLWIGIVLPFTFHRPWKLSRAPLVVELERKLRRVLREGKGNGRDFLLQLLGLPERLAPLSKDLARQLLRMPRDGSIPYK